LQRDADEASILVDGDGGSPLNTARMAGVTLIELIAVMLIIGILSVSVVTVFDNRGLATVSFGDQVQAQVAYAQKVAVAQRTTVYVVVASGSVDVCYDSGCAGKVSSPSGAANFTLNAPTGVTITAGTGTFSFNALGQAAFSPASGTRTITVSGSGTRSFTIEAETGYVHR